MRRVFEEELESLHAHFLKMGVLVNAAIHKSIDAFVTHDKELAALCGRTHNLMDGRLL